MNYLVETALLTHGIDSVTQEELRKHWDAPGAQLAWVENGCIVTGSLSDYLPLRARSAKVRRISSETLDLALQSGQSGALTASGTMEVCRRMQIPLAVTCGMGGIGALRGEHLCPDLPALCSFGVALIAASPKDMLDLPATLGWLREHGVHISGEPCTGYLFCAEPVTTEMALSACHCEEEVKYYASRGGLLLLQPIPEYKRIRDRAILREAVRQGRAAEAAGKEYHPAANASIDRATKGRSALIQLEALLANIHLAESL